MMHIAPEISLHKVRDLLLQESPQPHRPAHLSAASGLVRIDERLYVVADDELQLAMFSATDTAPGSLIRILPGKLPRELKPRKRTKPDFESLLLLPANAQFNRGALLALGSGSTPLRRRAVVLPIANDGRLDAERMQVIDLTRLFAAVEREVGEVNIEGAVVVRNELLLFQRGNKGSGINATIAFELEVISASLAGRIADPIAAKRAQRYELGSVRGIPLGFSDAAALADGSIVFAAIAEDTDNAYADGVCAGAVIGFIDAGGALRGISPVANTAKIEGIHARGNGPDVELLLVTDADDPSIPASLYETSLRLD